jgi:hypothetical protein
VAKRGRQLRYVTGGSPPEASEIITRWSELQRHIPAEHVRTSAEYLSAVTGVALDRVHHLRVVRNGCAHPAAHGWPSGDDASLALDCAKQLLTRLQPVIPAPNDTAGAMVMPDISQDESSVVKRWREEVENGHLWRDPEDQDCARRALMYELADDPVEAQMAASEVNNEDIWLMLAEIREENGDIDGAEEAILESGPDAFWHLMLRREWRGDKAGAEAAAAMSANPRIWQKLGDWRREHSDAAGAERAYRRGIEANSSDGPDSPQ